ncbi:MAG: RidA family protein [bacterium]|nr:RidA family protein [bacterium]
MDITRINPGPRMSSMVIHGETIYLAGQVAANPNGDTAAQTRDIVGKIDALLNEAGSDKSKLLAATIYLTDIRDFVAMNEVWDAWVATGNTPARTCVQASLARPNIRVEITVIAAK